MAAAETSSSSSTIVPVTSRFSDLSGGAIAGIVVGVVIGVAGLTGIFIFICWRSQRKKRTRQQEESVRNVKWVTNVESRSRTPKGNIALGDLRK